MDSVDRAKRAVNAIRAAIPRAPGQPDLVAPLEAAFEDISHDLDAISVLLKGLAMKAHLSTGDVPGYVTLAPPVKRRVDDILS
jgi:hypothetical protein